MKKLFMLLVVLATMVPMMAQAAPRGDALIKKGSEPDSAYGIDNVYQFAPSGNQVENQNVIPDSSVTYQVKVQNDGDAGEIFVLRPRESTGSGWTIRYNGVVVSDWYYQEENWLEPGESWIVTVQMTSSSSVAQLSSKSATLDLYHYDAGDSYLLLDSVRATATCVSGTGSSPSDLQIGLSTSSLAGNNIYNLTGTNQTTTQTKSPNTVTTYIVRVQNDGGSSDKFKIVGSASDSAWKVQYFDAVSGGNNITSLVTGSGWTTPSSLAPQAFKDIRVTVKPGAAGTITGPVGGEQKDVLVMATSMASPTKKDVVKASTIVTVVNRLDAFIKKGVINDLYGDEDPAYAINNVYQSTPSGDQIETQMVNRNEPAGFVVKIQNDGNTPRRFLVRSTESAGSGWTMSYAAIEDGDIFHIDSLDYWTVILDGGESDYFYVEMTPGSSVAAGSSKSLTANVFFGTTDTTVKDSVKATSTVASTAFNAMAAEPLTASSATAEAVTSLIRLRFSTPLDAAVASDASHYRVQINGIAIAVESASYQFSTNTVILAVPEGSLHGGDTVMVFWDDLLDTRGHLLSGQIGPFTAR